MKNVFKLTLCLAIAGFSTIKSEEQADVNKVEKIEQNKLNNFKQILSKLVDKTNANISHFTKHEDFVKIRNFNDLKSWFKKLPTVTKVIVVGETLLVVVVVAGVTSLYIALETGLIKIPKCGAGFDD